MSFFHLIDMENKWSLLRTMPLVLHNIIGNFWISCTHSNGLVFSGLIVVFNFNACDSFCIYPSLLAKTCMKHFMLVLLLCLRRKWNKALFFFSCHFYVKPINILNNFFFYVFTYLICKPMIFSFH